VPGDTNGTWDIFVRDRTARVTQRVSVNPSGAQTFYGGVDPSISADGRYVAFASQAGELVSPPINTGRVPHIFVRDMLTGAVEWVSVRPPGVAENLGTSYLPSISDDGRYVSFTSFGNYHVPGDTNLWEDVFLRDRGTETTERISVGPSGAQNDGEVGFGNPISGDGRYVAFDSWGSALVAGDTNDLPDVFERDVLADVTERVSVDS